MYLRSEYPAAGWPGACFARAGGTAAMSLYKTRFKREKRVNLWVFQLVQSNELLSSFTERMPKRLNESEQAETQSFNELNRSWFVMGGY